MDIKIKMEAVVAGLLAVKDKIIFTCRDNTIIVSTLDNLEENYFILFDNDGFFLTVLSQEEYKIMLERFGDAVE